MEAEMMREQLRQFFLDTYLRLAELDRCLVHSPGTFIWKGKYSYWQYYVKGRQIQKYVRAGAREEVQRQIAVMKEQNRRRSVLRQDLTAAKRSLKAFGVHWQEVLAGHEEALELKQRRLSEQQEARKTAAKKKYTEQYKHATDRGDLVASKSEEMIANLLFSRGIRYEYEKPLMIGQWHLKPDFTVWRKDGTMLIWEHAGLMHVEEYARKFREKLRVYESAGFVPQRNLIVTVDEDGAFSVEEARRMIQLYKLD